MINFNYVNYFKNWRNSRFWLALLFIATGLYTLFHPKLARELVEKMKLGRFYRMEKAAQKHPKVERKANRDL